MPPHMVLIYRCTAGTIWSYDFTDDSEDESDA